MTLNEVVDAMFGQKEELRIYVERMQERFGDVWPATIRVRIDRAYHLLTMAERSTSLEEASGFVQEAIRVKCDAINFYDGFLYGMRYHEKRQVKGS